MKNLIKKIVDLSYRSKEGHIPSSLSILDILHVLYTWDVCKDDIFILSKGHGCLALYVVLNEIGKISDDQLNSFCQYGSKLGGHPTRDTKLGIEASTGSLGHGLPMAVGVAYARKIKKETSRVYCLVGDQECNEGTIWESFLLAKEHNLNNLTIIIDNNQSYTRSLSMEGIGPTLGSDLFDFHVEEINGHDKSEIYNALCLVKEKPIAIIANTIKGKGIKMMENSPFEWHHRSPNEDEYLQIMKELE